MVSRRAGPLQPSINRFRLGDFEITNLLDSTTVRTGLHPKFGANQSDADVQRLARENHLDTQRFLHPFAPTLVDTGTQAILFDTGNGDLRHHFPAFAALPEGRLVTLLAEAGYRPEDIDLVVITHGHPDHIGGLMIGDKPTFPNARTVFGAAEFDFWTGDHAVREWRHATRDLFRRRAAPLRDRATFIKPGDEVAPGIVAVDAAGHSPGQLAFHIESQGKRALLWGDVVIHYVLSLQRPDWQIDVDDDKEQAVATRKRILDMVATDGLCAIGFHMPFPGLGFVERVGGSYRWVPATYQFSL